MFRLKLFGGALLEGSDTPLTGRAVQRRRLALLAMLAVARGRGHTRDKLIAYLWPDSDTERARHLLSDSIYRINQAIGGEAIHAAGDTLLLNTERVSADAWEFSDAIDRGDWETAVALHTAPFLDGFYLTGCDDFERWAEAERTRLARERARALESLAVAAVDHEDHTAAVHWWRILAADDPYSSRIALQLMQALENAGDRAAAVQHARIHSVMVRDQLGVDADPEVARFAERLRTADSDSRGSRGAESNERAQAENEPVAGESGRAAMAAESLVTAERGASHAIGDGEDHRRMPWTIRAGAVLAVIALATAIGAYVRSSRATSEPPPPTSIAVLPFADLSSSGDQAYFADGIAEELMARLSKVEGLAVVGRTSAFAFKDSALDVRDIGARLGVSAVLAGSVRRADDRLRIVAQLMDASNGYELWSETYQREMEDVFAIQDEIARAIVTRLHGQLTGAEADVIVAATTDDPEAYNLYLQGRFEWHKRTERGLRAAAELFRRATDRVPTYARAWVGLGDAYAVLGFYDYLPPTEAFPRAAEAARRALELDPSIAEAHATLGYVALYHDWQWARAESEFRQAIDLYPGYSTGHQWYANLLTAMGRFDEAIHEMRTAQDLDPLSLIANAALGFVLHYAGEHERSIDQFSRTLELDPNFELAYLWRGMAQEELGRLDQALADLRRAVELSDGSAISRAALARTYFLAGDADSGTEILNQIEAESTGYVPAFEIAKIHEARGDRNAAMRWLRRAHRERSHSMAFLAVDPQLRRIRGDPDIQRLVKEVGLDRPAKPDR